MAIGLALWIFDTQQRKESPKGRDMFKAVRLAKCFRIAETSPDVRLQFKGFVLEAQGVSSFITTNIQKSEDKGTAVITSVSTNTSDL